MFEKARSAKPFTDPDEEAGPSNKKRVEQPPVPPSQSTSKVDYFLAWVVSFLNKNQIKYRLLSLLVMAGVATVLAIFKYNLSVNDEKNAARLYFASTVQSVSSSLESEFYAAGLYHKMLLNHIITSKKIPTKAEYAQFTDQTVFWNITNVILGESLALRITNDTRAAYEEFGRSIYGSGFRMTERNVENVLVAAGDRREYFSVIYIEPFETNRAVVGFDIFSEPRRAAAIKTSVQTGSMVPSNRVQLVQSKKPEFSTIALIPFYRPPSPIPSPHSDISASTIQGFVDALKARGIPLTMDLYLGALNSGAYTSKPSPGAEVMGVLCAACVYQVILDDAIEGIDLFMVDVILYMTDAPEGVRYLAHQSGPSDDPSFKKYTMDDLQASEPGTIKGDIVVSHKLFFGIRPYRLDIIARTGYFKAKMTDVPTTLLVVSLLGSVFGQFTTIIAVGYIFYQRKRNKTSKDEVVRVQNYSPEHE